MGLSCSSGASNTYQCSCHHDNVTKPQSTTAFTDLFSLHFLAALDAIISHPDEMENLEQYRVLAEYERKDSHQVNLMANQLVYVIEKHDTGELYSCRLHHDCMSIFWFF